MDSPARDQAAAAANDVQGSPFFNYLCSLSPIQTVKTVHVAQTYSELTFPSAPTVFVSPQLGPKKTIRRVEQCDKEHRRNIFLELDNNQNYFQTARSAATAGFGTTRSYPLGVENVPPSASNAVVAAVKGLGEQANYSPVKNCAGTTESLQALPAEQNENSVTLENVGDRKVLEVTQRGLRRCLDFQASNSGPPEDSSLADIGLEHSVETVPTGSDVMAEDHDSLIFCSTQESSSSHLDVAMASIMPSASPCSAEALLLHASVDEPVHNLDERPPAVDMLQQSDGAEEMSETPESPRRRKASENSKDGCKRCKCKKSRCLKLYCECFSAGVYCVGSCTCRDCFNNLDHADTVLEARQQIEIRNPLAFAPKVVPASETPPTDREENWKTPGSARHKRGCKCKKSMCLKKYCECYQVGVGCSQVCRCEGCKNLYGKKEGPEAEELDLSKLDPMDKDFLDSQAAGRTSSKNLSPMTPYLGNPGSQANTTISKKKRPVDHMGSPLPSASGSRKQSSKKKLSRQTFSPLSAEGPTKPPAASPRWDGLDDICTLTPLPSHPTRPTPSSVATSDTSHSAAPSSAADVTPSFHLPFPVAMNPFFSPLGLPAWDKTSAGMEDAANTPPGLRKLVLQEPPA